MKYEIYYNIIKFLAKILGKNAINIDEYKENEIDLTVNKTSYENYIKKYITINDSKYNYQIITETILNDFEEKK